VDARGNKKALCVFSFFLPRSHCASYSYHFRSYTYLDPILADAYIYQRPAKQYARSQKAAVTAHLDGGRCAAKTAAVDEGYEALNNPCECCASCSEKKRRITLKCCACQMRGGSRRFNVVRFLFIFPAVAVLILTMSILTLTLGLSCSTLADAYIYQCQRQPMLWQPGSTNDSPPQYRQGGEDCC